MSSDANNTLTEAFLGLAADARKVFLADLIFDLSTMARDSYGEREQPGLWRARHRARAFNNSFRKLVSNFLLPWLRLSRLTRTTRSCSALLRRQPGDSASMISSGRYSTA